MTIKRHLNCMLLKSTFMVIVCCMVNLNAQIAPGVYISDVNAQRHEVKITDDYLIHTVYGTSPAKFVKTMGGYYTAYDDQLNVKLEFNSDYETDGLREITIPFAYENGDLVLKNGDSIKFGIALPSIEQDLDGQWLFATRGPDEGQERRGDENPRKTLKFLKDGRFQWIAYHTENMKFSGTGGGIFTSQDGVYTENIEYFSRDDSRVGARLEFSYELKGNDWHHKGKNSKGEPMYEIWARR